MSKNNYFFKFDRPYGRRWNLGSRKTRDKAKPSDLTTRGRQLVVEQANRVAVRIRADALMQPVIAETPDETKGIIIII